MPISQRLNDPRFLLCLTAALLAFVVQSGELATSDTTHRLQTTHWLWTSEPQVFPNEYPEFGLHGRGGRLYSWYGIGQSLLMLPADLIATPIAHLRIFAHYTDDPAVRSIIVSYSTNILVNVLTALIAFRFLQQLRFSLKQSIAGVLALLFCTTHLHYTQNMMENNYIMLLTLLGFSYQYQWLRIGSRRALFIGSAALGLNLLTRLTTGLDLIAVGFFLLLILLFERTNEELVSKTGFGKGTALAVPSSVPSDATLAAEGQRTKSRRAAALWSCFLAYIKISAPVYAFFLLIDRLYNYYRFESFTTTYVTNFSREFRQNDPTLPANFPWTTPFHEGVLGALFKPEKSIFLFDPLLILSIILFVILWKRLSPEIRAYALASVFMLTAYICFYARYAFWAGDFAWGDRYVSTSVEFVAFISVPLLLRFRTNLSPWIWRGGLALIFASLIIQLASLAFWLPLEIYQMETLGHPTFVIALRFKNIAAFALGKMDAWGLNNESMTQDPWDYVHITCWNFLPFLLRRVGAAPAWVVKLAFAVWFAGIAALGWVLLRLRNALLMPRADT